MQDSRVCIFLLTRCLIRPSGERSHGISLALMTFGRVAYWARNSADSAIASSRKLLVLAPDSAARLSSNDVMAPSQIRWRMKFVDARRQLVGRPFHHLLEQEVHEQE